MCPAPAPGTSVSHYDILSKLGEGGMGLVFKAVDRRLGRTVAIKFLNPALIDVEEATQRFEREARAISALNHPHIATLYDVGWEKGQPYLVLEYLPGGTLAERIKGRQLPFDEIIQSASQIAGGLDYAHREGIVHRDLKPGNVMIAASGDLKIADFGLSKFSRAAEITSAGTRMGTIAYMAPEQARGDDVDQRADIFSLGVMLYEFAAGRRPFRGGQPEAVLHQILNVDPPPLRSIRPDLPQRIALVVERALAKNPAERYNSAADLLRDLVPRTPDSGQPPTVTLTSLPVRPVARRRKMLAALLALALLSGFLLWRWGPWRPAIPAQMQIAVLPFADLDGAAGSQPFCDGLTEALTGALSRMERYQTTLSVIPASEIRAAAIRKISDAQRVFNANLAITGSVQRTPGEIRVIVNLSDAGKVRQLDSRSVTVPRDQSPQLETVMLAGVFEMLQVQLAPNLARAASKAPRNPAAYDLYLEAQGYLQRPDELGQDLDAAIDRLGKALRVDPGFAPARAALSIAASRRFKRTSDRQWLDRAADEASQAIALDDKLPESHLARGIVAGNTGLFEEAVREFERALALDPSNAETRRQMANAYVSLNNLDRAEQVYQEAVRLKPGWASAYDSLGVFYLQHRSGDKTGKAEECFKTATTLAPGNARAHAHLGALYLIQYRYDEAVPVLKRAIEIGSDDKAYSNLGWAYFAVKQYRQAAEAFQSSLRANPNNGASWGNLGDALQQVEGDSQSTRDAYRKAVELSNNLLAVNPKDAVVRSTLAVCQSKLGDCEPARANIAWAIKTAPANKLVVVKAARVLERCGDHAGAVEHLISALRSGYALKAVEAEPDLARLLKDARVMAFLASQARK